MKKNLFAIKQRIPYEIDEIVSIWTTEAEAKDELRKVRRTVDAEHSEFYLAEVRLNNRDMFVKEYA